MVSIAPDPRGNGLPITEVHSPKQENTLEKGKNIPKPCRIYKKFVWDKIMQKGLALHFHHHFYMKNISYK